MPDDAHLDAAATGDDAGIQLARPGLVVHDPAMPLRADDEARILAYFRARDRHVAQWRGSGAAWEPFEGAVPVEAMQAAALHHPNPRLRREALGVLDHAANDESTATFRAALADPVPRVRLVALHGLSCERCRTGEICTADVVADVLRTLRADTNPRVRHATIDVLGRFIGRDERIIPALRHIAITDSDELVRLAASSAADGERKVWSRKAVRRRLRARSHGHAAPERSAGLATGGAQNRCADPSSMT